MAVMEFQTRYLGGKRAPRREGVALYNRLRNALPKMSLVTPIKRPAGVNHHMNWETLTHGDMGRHRLAAGEEVEGVRCDHQTRSSAGSRVYIRSAWLSARRAAQLYSPAAAALRYAAQRFLVASAMRLRPSALRTRFCLGAFAAEADGLPFFNNAHRFLCASAIRLRPSSLIPPPEFFDAAGLAAAATFRPPSLD